MNIANPYTHRRRPRHRQARRLAVLAVACLSAIFLTLACNPPEESSTTPQDSAPAANPGGGAVPLDLEPIAARSGAQSAHEFYAWYSASPRNAAYYHLRDEFGTGRLGDQAVRVGVCESDLNPRARSSTNDHGVMQINAVHRRQFERVTGRAWPDVYHASFNAAYARWLYDQQGWGPWTCRP